MTIFYFDIQIGTDVQSIDGEGHDVAHVEAARIEAATIVCDLARNMIERKELADMSVLVRDQFGELLVLSLK